MMMLHRLAVVLALGPGAALAESPMSPAAFEQFSEGRTLTWALDGVAYGIERYAPGRRVIWADLSGTCLSGTWQAAGDEVCFFYDDDPDGLPACWRFARDGKDVVADQTRVEDPLRLTVVSETGALVCPDYGS